MLASVVRGLMSLALGAVFLASAWPKLRRPKGFEITVANYDVLPPVLIRAFARVVPPVELVVGTFLMTGTLTRPSALAAASLLGIFIVAVGVNVARGRDIECGCFGGGDRTVGPSLLLQDIALCLAAVGVARLAPGWTTSTPLSALGLDLSETQRAAYGVASCLGASAAAWTLLSTVASKERRWKAEPMRG